MKTLFASLALFASLTPMAVYAAPAETLKVEQSVEINAKAENVWALVSNFGDLGLWHPAVRSTEIISGTPNLQGAVRVVTLVDGGKLQEELETYSPEQKIFSYKILGGVLPVSSYHSTFSVVALSDTKSKVTWSGSFKRKDVSEKPVTGQTDEDAKRSITVVYKMGLDSLKKIAEGR
jgi:mxaD protein